MVLFRKSFAAEKKNLPVNSWTDGAHKTWHHALFSMGIIETTPLSQVGVCCFKCLSEIDDAHVEQLTTQCS